MDLDNHSVERSVLQGGSYRLESTNRERITYTAGPVRSRPERIDAGVNRRKVW